VVVVAETGDAGGVSITGGKSPPLVNVALSFVAGATDGVVVGVAAEAGLVAAVAAAADTGLKEDSAVCVLLSLVGGLVTAMAEAGGLATVETGVVGGTATLVRLAPPLTMSERRLLATEHGVVLSFDGVPWPLASPSRKPGKGGKAASSRSNLGASTFFLALAPAPSAFALSAFEPFYSFFLRLSRFSVYFGGPPPCPGAAPGRPWG
ncbi:unnamed protein product, partial [Ixodes hexagonus]